PAADRCHAHRRGLRAAHLEGLHLLRDGILGDGRDAEPEAAVECREAGPPAHALRPSGGYGELMAKVKMSTVRAEALELIRKHRRSLAAGLVLMVIGRIAAFVLPMSSKFLIDEVITQGRSDLLLPIAGAVLAATLVQAATGFAVAKVVSVAAQRA